MLVSGRVIFQICQFSGAFALGFREWRLGDEDLGLVAKRRWCFLGGHVVNWYVSSGTYPSSKSQKKKLYTGTGIFNTGIPIHGQFRIEKDKSVFKTVGYNRLSAVQQTKIRATKTHFHMSLINLGNL